MLEDILELHKQGKLEEAESRYRELLTFKSVSEVFGEMVALRNVVSGAPEIDRPQVQDLLSRSFAKQITPLEVD